MFLLSRPELPFEISGGGKRTDLETTVAWETIAESFSPPRILSMLAKKKSE
jgi:hypothetical protein